MNRPQFDGVHQIAGQIKSSLHSSSSLVLWFAVKK
jgi:hypothetical protein